MHASPDCRSAIERLEVNLRLSPRPRVPALYCPFDPAVHAEVHRVQASSVAWAASTGLVSGERGLRRLDASKIGWLVARAYPRGEVAAVQLAADWTTLFCLLDDHLERLESPLAVAARLAELAGVFRTGAAPGPDPMRRACADLRDRMRAAASPAFQARFQARLDQLFEAFTTEAEVRAARRIPALAAYLPMREVTVGLHVEFEIGELADGIALDDARRAHPLRAELARRASNIVAWANDVYTYEKELAGGETTNLVAVLARTEDLGLGDALARAAALHDEEVRAFVALSGELPAADAELRRYAAMLRAWVRGHLDWAHETGRYDPVRNSHSAAVNSH